MAANGTLTDDHVAFLRGPTAAFLATTDPTGVPDATRANGVTRVGPNRLRVLISSDAEVALRNVAARSTAAVLVTDITTYRSLQWKGSVVDGPQERTLHDLTVVDAEIAAFATSSALVGVVPARAHRFYAADVVAVEVDVREVFDQTPGPRAGQRIER